MDPEQIPGAILFTLICVLVAMGLWYLGQRRNTLRFKQIAVMVGLIPVLWIGLQVLEPLLDRPAEYRSAAVGPTSREASASPSVAIPVTNAAAEHEIEVRPKIRGGNPPDQPLHLDFQVRSPKGETLAQGASDLPPGKRLRWQSLRARFQPREEGEHTLTLVIPQPVSSVDIVVRELRK